MRKRLIPYPANHAASGVKSTYTEDDADFIIVVFKASEADGYYYDCAHRGLQHIEAMKRLARDGRGLSGYISQHPKEISGNYAKIIPVTAGQSVEI